MKPFSIIVTGGREYWDRTTVNNILHTVIETARSWNKDRRVMVYYGDATGTDEIANEYVLLRMVYDKRISYQKHFADWTRYGRAAGPIRNAVMFAAARPDIVVAFPGGTGTANMVSIARKTTPIMVVNQDGSFQLKQPATLDEFVDE